MEVDDLTGIKCDLTLIKSSDITYIEA